MKKILGLIVIFTVIMSICTYPVSAAITLPQSVRVGLFYNTTALSTAAITGESVNLTGEGFDAVNGNSFTVAPAEGGLMVNGLLYMRNVLEFHPVSGFVSVNSKPYRGYIRLIKNSDNKITVVNVVNTEEYLYGVLPLEMSTGWPIEALKAQALCARSYVAMNIGKFESYGFDVTDTTLSQVYGGVRVEKDDCTRAVNETKGMVVTYGGKICSTVYFSTSSGTTLDVKDVWGSEGYPYLVPVDDSLQSTVIDNNGAWSVSYTKEELASLFDKKGYGLGEILDMNVDSYNAQGAVTSITVKGSNASKTFTKGKTRDFLGLRSQTYTITKQGQYSGEGPNAVTEQGTSVLTGAVSVISENGTEKIESGMNVITSSGIASVSISQNFVFSGVKIDGTGYGHGIGMSQNGAKALAKNGYTFDVIIKHYYTGVSIETISY